MIPGWAIIGAALLWLGSTSESRADDAAATDFPTGKGGSMGDATGASGRIYSPSRLTPRQRIMADLIVSAARRAGQNPAFMLALAVTESSLNPSAIGDDGKSIGLFQLLLTTARLNVGAVTADTLLDPETNARIAMLEMGRVIRAYPGHSYGEYAEAWTLGPRGKFELGRRNPNKLVAMERAARDLDLTLNLNERAA